MLILPILVEFDFNGKKSWFQFPRRVNITLQNVIKIIHNNSDK